MNVHVTGASGSGTTTLARALADALALRHFDADDYYWLPTSPAFKQKRDPSERFALLCNEIQVNSGIVLSGSVMGWGPEIEDSFSLIVFLYLPAELRIERLRRRELAQLGQVDEAFLQWAAEYDKGPSEGRSLAKHEHWLAQRACPILRLHGDLSIAERVARVLQALRNPSLHPTRNSWLRQPSRAGELKR
ncbi:MAG TPA: AAA family ATPase [Nitrospiraceae bacterium]|nr:AAA family ATPase [Nitrospiraceae bacterium]